ncbi:MAG: CsgG/HfaB family protein [Gemmatimonas sp.]
MSSDPKRQRWVRGLQTMRAERTIQDGNREARVGRMTAAHTASGVVGMETNESMTRDLLSMMMLAGALQAPPRVAVLDFSNGTPVNPEAMEPLRRALGTTLAGALARSGRVGVIERNRLSALMAEQDLARTGRVDDATAARVGKLLGVSYLFVGAFIVQPNGEMLVSTRLVDVATGTVTAGPEVLGDTRSATKLMDRLASAISKQLKLPADTTRAKPGNVRDSPELSAAIDALAQACDARHSVRVSASRAAVEKRAPGHPALAAPCY